MFCIQHLNRRDDVDAVSVISVFVLVGELVAGDTTEAGREGISGRNQNPIHEWPPSLPVGRTEDAG